MQSAPAEVPANSESRSERPETQPERPKGSRLRLRWSLPAWLPVIVLAATLGIILLVATRHRGTAIRDVAPVSNHTNLNPILRLKGTTEAVQSRAVLAPLLAGQQVSTLTIVRLSPGGTRVKPGDLLVEFDRQAQMRDFVDKQAEYSKLANQVLGEQAKEGAARAKDETELKQAESNLRKAELEVQKAEIVSRIDVEKNQQNLEETKATFAQLGETFGLKRKAATAAIRILEIQRDRIHQTMLHAQANAQLMQIHSVIEGVVVLNTIWKQGTMGEVQEGDQVRPGVPFMQVVTPSLMQVRVLANQQDFLSLRIGQTVKVHLDAYPELVLPGKIEQLAPIGEGGNFSAKLRTFVVIVSIEGSNPKLMPDLSAAVDVEVSGQSDSGNGS